MDNDINTLLTNARNILKSYTDTLQEDVRHCIFYKNSTPDWPAPFPAIIYCFSIIDMLAFLYNRNQSEKESKEQKTAIDEIKKLDINSDLREKAINGIKYPISENARKYMIEVMSYPELQTKLLQRIFRNPLVHQAQPKPVIKLEKKKYTWQYYHKNRIEHLSLIPLDSNIILFKICIWSLVEDITDLIFKPNGYLNKLEIDSNLQKNFHRKLKDMSN